MIKFKTHPYIEMFSKESVFNIPHWPPTKKEYIDAINSTQNATKKKEIAFLCLLVGIKEEKNG